MSEHDMASTPHDGSLQKSASERVLDLFFNAVERRPADSMPGP